MTTQPRNTSHAARSKVTIHDAARAPASRQTVSNALNGFFSVTVRPWQVMMQAWPGEPAAGLPGG